MRPGSPPGSFCKFHANLPLCFKEFQKVLLDKLLKLSREVEHMSRIVSRIGVSSVDASGLNLPGGLVLPLKDGREFALLNQWLEKQNNQSKLVSEAALVNTLHVL